MVEIASTFRRGLVIAACRPPTAIILDATIPDLDATVLADMLRATGASTPVLILSQGDQIAITLPTAQLNNVSILNPGWAPEAPVFEALQQQGIV